MVIANPLYDIVFKRMMENERVAKFFIGTLLEQNIDTIEVQPQEFTYRSELARLSVFRLDFIATIKTDSGEYKKILIEIQKARNHIDLMRFRRYLGEQYTKTDTVGGLKTVLPITTIYILGFTLPDIESACIRVERHYKDLINKQIIDKKSDFIEKLTHDSYIVQVHRITDRFQTSLDKLLSVFEQRNFLDDQKIIKEFLHPTEGHADFKIMTDILHHAGVNSEERKRIEDEQEAWRTVQAMFEESSMGLFQALEERDKALRAQEQALQEQEHALQKKEQTLLEQARLIEELKRKLDEK